MRWAFLALVLAGGAQAQDYVEVPEQNASDGYTPPDEKAIDVLVFTGYLDVGFAKATGTGSSFLADDTRIPADYFADAFAPAVNSRGEVASTVNSAKFTNGFLPRSVGAGGRPTFLLNTASVDVRFQPRTIPILVFLRAQLMPRFSSEGDSTQVLLQQAFGRISPFETAEFAISIGRFDSVFGIEYLENEANLRVGITPSLTARYTTGQSLGVKAFYRVQLPTLWSAVSFNVAATNSGTRIDALVGPDVSLTGAPVGSARLGYELNLQHLQAKVGLSGVVGPRNDSRSMAAKQIGWAADVRVHAYGLSLAGELVQLHDDPSAVGGKTTGTGPAELASQFDVFGGWLRLAYALPWTFVKAIDAITLYGRYDRRGGRFEGLATLVTDRFTLGAKVDLLERVSLKVEGLINREISGARPVDNDVFTTSAVFTW